MPISGIDTIVSAKGSGKTKTSLVHLMRAEQERVDAENKKRRDIVNACKKSLAEKFDRQVKLLHHRNAFESDFTDKMFVKAMGDLIIEFQTKLDKLKKNGMFYNESDKIVVRSNEVDTLLAPIEEVKEDN